VLRDEHETRTTIIDIRERLACNLSVIVEAISPAVIVGESVVADTSTQQEGAETTVPIPDHLAVVVDSPGFPKNAAAC
jgi:hypothetical protein